MYRLDQDGEAIPFFQTGYRLAIRTDNQLKLLNRETGEEVWSLALEANNFARLVQYNQRTPSLQPRFYFQSLGHLVVVQVGHLVYAIDPVQKRELWKMNLAAVSGMPAVRNIPVIDPRDGSVSVVYTDGWMQRIGQTGPLSPTALAVVTGDARLLGLDPISGRILWSRNDVSKNCHLYNDADYVYTVEMGNDGTTGTTRVFRLHDGVAVQTRDFSDLYGKRVSMKGRRLFTRETDVGGVIVRLYDIIQGKDLWANKYPVGTFVLQTEEDNLGGVVEPNGKVTVVDLTTLKPVLEAQMKPEHIANLESAQLIRDANSFYIACNDKLEDKLLIANTLMANTLPGTGIRSIPVDGYLYSFSAKTGELDWYNLCKTQMLILDEFENLPVVLLTSRYTRWTDANRFQQMAMVALRSYDKRTGKLLWDRTEQNTGRYQQFHSIKVDTRAGRVDLKSYNLRWTHTFNDAEGGGAGGKTTPVDRGTSRPGTRPRFQPQPIPGIQPAPRNQIRGGIRFRQIEQATPRLP
jgi:outer membrane protein assembly factor BamB